MYIYLDESYNLKDRTKPQFISINGFLVVDVKTLFKKWKEVRKPFVGKRRIHATDSAFDGLRDKAVQLVRGQEVVFITVFQIIQEIPFQSDENYFRRGKLNFEKVYADLLKILLSKLNIGEYRNANIIIHSRKYKGRVLLGKVEFKNNIKSFLEKLCPQTNTSFKIQTASTDVLLELADFISNIFYRAYICKDQKIFQKLQFTLMQIKNPLKSG